MDSLLFEIKDNKDELHRVVVSDIGSILTIMLYVCVQTVLQNWNMHLIRKDKKC